jgi:hypothetical protein
MIQVIVRGPDYEKEKVITIATLITTALADQGADVIRSRAFKKETEAECPDLDFEGEVFISLEEERIPE